MEFTSSPCLAICRLDPVSGHCIGCGRTTLEIARWVEMSEAERLSLMRALPGRFETVSGLAAARRVFEEEGQKRSRTGRRRSLSQA